MSKKYQTTIELRGGEGLVVVEYTAHKADPGGKDGREYPPEPAWVEIEAVTYGGCTITDELSDIQIAALAEEIEVAEDDERIACEQDHWDNVRKDARYPEFWEGLER